MSGNLQDVVGGFQNVVITTNSEGQVRIFTEGRAVNSLSTLVGEGLNHFSDELLGTNQDGGTSVDDGVLELIGLVTQGDLRNIDNPPGFKGDGVILEGGRGELGINTTQTKAEPSSPALSVKKKAKEPSLTLPSCMRTWKTGVMWSTEMAEKAIPKIPSNLEARKETPDILVASPKVTPVAERPPTETVS